MKIKLILFCTALFLVGMRPSYADTSLSEFVQFTGEADTDYAGNSVASGDINGDGYQDMVIGAYRNDDGGSASGAVYVIYGQSSTLSSDSLSNAVEFSGESASNNAGYTVATGDVNNDGYDDILIGAISNSDAASGAGAVYLVYGQSSTLSSDSLSNAVEFTGEAFDDNAGESLAMGDINNDGYADMLIGASHNDDNGSNAGAVYLIYGKASAFSSGSLSTRTQFSGKDAGNYAGTSVTTGDVNNDGYNDILIGAYGNSDASANSGAVHLIYGQSVTFSSASLGPAITFTGEASGDGAGIAIATGDVNNDSYDDILIGAYRNDDGASEAGAVYLIYGKSSAFSSGSLGTRVEFTGEAASDRVGQYLATGDVNNDSYDDILIGTYNNDDGGSSAGAVYLLYGKSTGFSSGSLATRVQFTGEATNDYAGPVATGDINNDGFSDLVVGAYGNDDGVANAGAAYLGYLLIDADGDSVAGLSGVFNGSDCNDSDSTVATDQTYYQDADGDGLGSDVTTSVCSASAPPYYVTNSNDANDSDYDNDGVSASSDCNDNNPAISTTQTYYQDSDGDGLGSDVSVTVCTIVTPEGYATNSNDQNDSSYDSGFDYDSDGVASTDDCDDTDNTVSTTTTYYRDSDGDGDGVSTESVTVCTATAPTGYSTNASDVNDSDYDNDGTSRGSDCNDADSTIATTNTYYYDADGDGLGDVATTTSSCTTTPPTGYVINSSDDDDTTASGDSDNDDDGVDTTSDCNDADPAVSEYQTYYQDADGDGYGNPDLSTSVCSATAPTGYVANALDTDDTDSSVTYGDIRSVAGTSNGSIVVTYEDDSESEYNIFTITTDKTTAAELVPNTTLVVVVHPKARKIALVEGLTGEVYITKALNSTAHSKITLRVKDLRSDNKYEAIVVSKRKTKLIHVHLFSIKTTQHKLKKRDTAQVRNKSIVPSKTKAKSKKIQLRSQKKKTIVTYRVRSGYRLKQVD